MKKIMLVFFVLLIVLFTNANIQTLFYFPESSECQGVPSRIDMEIWECYDSFFQGYKRKDISLVADCGREQQPMPYDGLLGIYLGDDECHSAQSNYTSVLLDLEECVSAEEYIPGEKGSFILMQCVIDEN